MVLCGVAKQAEPPVRAVLYRRVSTREQGDSQLGLDAQLASLTKEVDRRGWQVVASERDIASGTKTNGRQGLALLRRMLDGREADVLMIAKLDRLSRSVVDFAQLLKAAKRRGWAVVCLNPDVDTTTPNGKLCAGILMQVAEWEAEVISERTKDAMAAAKEKGARFGNPSPLNPNTLRLIRRLRKRGLGARRITGYLNEHEVPTPNEKGKRWHLSQVQRVIDREAIL